MRYDRVGPEGVCCVCTMRCDRLLLLRLYHVNLSVVEYLHVMRILIIENSAFCKR